MRRFFARLWNLFRHGAAERELQGGWSDNFPAPTAVFE